MPLHKELTEAKREQVLEELDAKLLAIMETQRKLRDRLATVKLDSDEAFEIKTLLLRLDMKADEIMRQKEAFEQDTLPLNPPSDEALEEMYRRIDEIRSMNVKDKTARSIAKGLVAVAGKLPKPPTG